MTMRGVQGMIDTDYRAIFPTFGIEPGEVVTEDKLQVLQ